MKIIATVVVAGAVLAAGLAAPLSAAGQAKKTKPAAAQPARPDAASARPRPKADGYVEQDSNTLPFGSLAWWDQMRREGRLGGETP